MELFERDKEKERDRKREQERERERDREQQIINKIEIDTYLFVKGNEQIKLGRLR